MATRVELRSVRFLIMCAGGLLAFVLLAILPSHRTLVGLDREIAGLTKEIEAQRTLQPLFRDLLDRAGKEAPSQLPFPKRTQLPRSETGTISSFFQKLARQNGYEVVTIVPEMVQGSNGPGHLQLETVIRGEFGRLRDLILQLEELPYLEHIESIQVKTGTDQKEIRLKLWLAEE